MNAVLGFGGLHNVYIILHKQVANRTQEAAGHCMACNVSLFISKLCLLKRRLVRFA